MLHITVKPNQDSDGTEEKLSLIERCPYWAG